MGLRKLKPTTPGQRFKVVNDFEQLTTGNKPVKSLILKKSKSGGRNNTGKMTMRHTGGGHKKRYRVIDFKRNKFGIPAVVSTVEYDPNRTAFIALLNYVDGEATPEVGNALYLADIPLGATIHNIELRPGQGGVMVRSAGAYAQLMARDGKYAIVKLASGEVRMVLQTCLASIGTVSNSEHSLQNSGKAGRSRWLGRRPRTRPVAMNPVDHPMGGGEGRASGGHPRSRNGIPAKGYKTRAKKNNSNIYIVERRKK